MADELKRLKRVVPNVNQEERNRFCIVLDSPNDWAEVIIDHEVVFRGFAIEAMEYLLQQIAIVDYLTIDNLERVNR